MRFKSFIFGLLLVGLVAAMYASPKTLFLKIAFKGSASPFNTLWNGTSDLASLLKSRGYTVVSPITSSELSEALSSGRKYDRIIYVVISPDFPLNPKGEDKLAASMLRQSGSKISVLIADEDITSNPFIEEYGVKIAGTAILYGDGNPFPQAVFKVPEKCAYRPGTSLVEPANYTEYILWLDWASFINITSPGTSKPCVIGVATAVSEGSAWFHPYIVGVLLDHSTTPLIGEGNMMVVLSDGSLFINSALRSSKADYKGFALSLFRLLSNGSKPEDTLIILDAAHYFERKIVDKDGFPTNAVPLPLVFHPAMLMVVALHMWRSAESWFYRYLDLQPLVGLPVILVASILTYGYLRRFTGAGSMDDTRVRRVEEVEILAETPVRMRYAGIRRISKGEALHLALDLYTLLDHVLEKSLGITVAEALENNESRRYLSRSTGIEEEELARILGRLKALKERAEGSRRFTPVILRWDAAGRRIIGDVEKVLEGLGYTLTSRSEKYRRLEYGVRGLF